jgi:tetratricopeptide (TPR) repeat protein
MGACLLTTLHSWDRFTRGAILAVLLSGVLCGPAAAQTAGPSVEGRTDQVERRVEALENTAITTLQFFGWLFGIQTFVFGVAGFIGLTATRRWVAGRVESKLSSMMKAEVANRLPQALQSVQRMAEEQILRLAKLLAMRANKAFDEVLTEVGWSGNVADLRNESTIFRRAFIDCLFNSKKDKKRTRTAAIQAVGELLADDPSQETVRLALRIYVGERRFQEGVELLERHRAMIESDKDSAMLAATVLRRQRKLADALKLAERFRQGADIQTLVTIASLKREMGDFGDVHDMLLPEVQRLTSYTGEYPPHNWQRLLNSFVACCLDRGHPEDGIKSAYYILRSSPGGVELLTVGRLAQRLPAIHPERSELITRFKKALPDLPDSEARFRCEVHLAVLEGQTGHAKHVLEEAIKRAEAGQPSVVDQENYFNRSQLAQILIDEQKYDEAIATLLPAGRQQFGGEAEYNLALAYAAKGREEDAVLWLGEALKEAPRWAAVARDDPRLRDRRAIATLLARSQNR